MGRGGSISGDVTVERYFKNKRAWRLVTAPVAGNSNNSIFSNWQTARSGSNTDASVGTTGVEIWRPGGGGGMAAGPLQSMRGWNNTTGAYNDFSSSTAETLFDADGSNPKSFFLFVSGWYGSNYITNTAQSGAVRISAKGALRQGNQSFSINSAVAGRYYMVGNPYASPVSYPTDGVGATNIENSVWIWDPNLSGANSVGGYVAFDRSQNIYSVSGTQVSGTNYTALQSGQAFFVRAASNGNLSVNFTESSKTGSVNNTLFRSNNESTPAQKIRATLIRNVGGDMITTDGGVAFFYDGAAPEVNTMDGRKLMNSANNLFFRRDGISLSFEHRPLIEKADTLYLSLRSTSAGNYRLVLEGSDFPAGDDLKAILQDLYLNREEPLSLSTALSYDFAVDAAAASTGDRFRIVFAAKEKTPPPPVDNTPSSFSFYPNPVKADAQMNLKFHKKQAGQYTAMVYDMQGKRVYQQLLNHGGGSSVYSLKPGSTLQAGNYIITILDANQQKVETIRMSIQ